MYKMNKANLFIVGAPRCATTTMYEVLKNHSNIFMTEPKEPHYFCTDLREEADEFNSSSEKYFQYKNEKEYIELYKSWNDEKYGGEASADYLVSTEAAENIYEFNSKSKIIVMLREPVELLHSLHSYFRFRLYENEEDFAKAIKLEKKRKENPEKIKTEVPLPSFLYYSQWVDFGTQISRYLEYFSQSQIKFVVFDDLKDNPEKVFSEVMNFLNVEKESFEVEKHNPDRKVWNKSLRILAYRVKNSNLFNSLPIKVQKFLKEIFRKVIAPENKRGDIDPELRKELMKKYKENVEEASELISRDLISLWGYDKI